MRLICYLRGFRGDRSLKTISVASGVSIPYLSEIERGRMLPRDEWLDRLAAAYGADVSAWYPSATRRAISADAAS